ncbi:hypothetical protein TNCV_224331 [Trichonephila clavipes]|nr:hypothetical protein TNCV_224331 [Trichonephila clavipes]
MFLLTRAVELKDQLGPNKQCLTLIFSPHPTSWIIYNISMDIPKTSWLRNPCFRANGALITNGFLFRSPEN